MGARVYAVRSGSVVCLLVTSSLFLLASCRRSGEAVGTSGPPGGSGLIHPVPFPDPGIPGFELPTPETTIVGWTEGLRGEGGDAIIRHGWGIWTGLTQETDQRWNDQALRVFETWDGPANLTCQDDACPRTPRPLDAPGQLGNKSSQLAVTVSYDPTAVQHILDAKLFDADHLKSLIEPGKITRIPPFPPTALALKPTYKVLTMAAAERYYELKVWPGPPAEPRAWGEEAWPTCVWVDTQDTGTRPGMIAAATTCGNNQAPPPESVVPLGEFVGFQLDAEEAGLARAAGITDAAEGMWAILVAMHVSSRELTRWTWQTYWWSPDPDAPKAPSSPAVAALRPSQLAANGAALRYAMCTGYAMLDPVQPNNGGDRTGGAPVYCYNPYLEATFTPADKDLPFPDPAWSYGGETYEPRYGVQTSCMSCHIQAAYTENGAAPQGGSDDGLYSAAQYIDLDAEQFVSKVTVDFLWSVADNAKPGPAID